MKRSGGKFEIVWETIGAPDAEERLSAAFAMLFSTARVGEPLQDDDLDRDDRPVKISSRYTSRRAPSPHERPVSAPH
jgi:hypothetical protein